MTEGIEIMERRPKLIKGETYRMRSIGNDAEMQYLGEREDSHFFARDVLTIVKRKYMVIGDYQVNEQGVLFPLDLRFFSVPKLIEILKELGEQI